MRIYSEDAALYRGNQNNEREFGLLGPLVANVTLSIDQKRKTPHIG